MAVSHQQILLDTYWATLTARPSFPNDDVLLVKTSEKDYADLERGSNSSGKYPQLFVFSSGYSASAPLKTFGVGSPVATLDYGVPRAISLNIRLVFDNMTDAQLMPLEAEVEAAIHATFIALRTAGRRWAGPPTPRNSRDNRQFAGKLRTVVAWTPSYECRPRLSELIS